MQRQVFMTEREVETVERKDEIVSGKTFLGIEFGSTRIKAVLTDADHTPIASGSHEWENRLDHGIWTYTMDDIWGGLQDCYRDLKKDVKEQYGVTLTKIRAIGFSAMMHGYPAFDKAGELLVPFRTWRNTITEEAAAALTKEFSYNIPQRWSIAHLYQAMLNKEEHVKDIAFFTTLAGFIHWKLTGEKVLGVGDASMPTQISRLARRVSKRSVITCLSASVAGVAFFEKICLPFTMFLIIMLSPLFFLQHTAVYHL